MHRFLFHFCVLSSLHPSTLQSIFSLTSVRVFSLLRQRSSAGIENHWGGLHVSRHAFFAIESMCRAACTHKKDVSDFLEKECHAILFVRYIIWPTIFPHTHKLQRMLTMFAFILFSRHRAHNARPSLVRRAGVLVSVSFTQLCGSRTSGNCYFPSKQRKCCKNGQHYRTESNPTRPFWKWLHRYDEAGRECLRRIPPGSGDTKWAATQNDISPEICENVEQIFGELTRAERMHTSIRHTRMRESNNSANSAGMDCGRRHFIN